MEQNLPISLKKVLLSNKETYAYRELGASEKILLLLHGSFTTSIFFESFMQEVSQHFRVIAPDMRGFGHSTYITQLDSLEDLCDDVKDFLEALFIPHVSVLGWSAGGAVAQLFACKYPTFVENLILVGSVGPRGTMVFDSYGKLMKSKDDFLACPRIQQSIEMIKSKNAKTIKFFLANAGFQNKDLPPDETLNRYIEEVKLQQNTVQIFYGLNNFNTSDEFNGICSGTKKIGQVQVPCLLIHGSQDENVRPESSWELKKYIKHARLEIIEGARHFLFEKPNVTKVVNLVQDFLLKEEHPKPDRQETQTSS